MIFSWFLVAVIIIWRCLSVSRLVYPAYLRVGKYDWFLCKIITCLRTRRRRRLFFFVNPSCWNATILSESENSLWLQTTQIKTLNVIKPGISQLTVALGLIDLRQVTKGLYCKYMKDYLNNLSPRGLGSYYLIIVFTFKYRSSYYGNQTILLATTPFLPQKRI